MKRRADVLVPQDDNPTNNMIRNRVSRRIVPEMAKAYNFEPKAYDIGRIGCYDAADNGFFVHTGIPSVAIRLIRENSRSA